jgi:hypothetical protein
MYFRMCWFRNRWRFAAYSIASLILASLCTLPLVLRYHNGEWSMELVSGRQADSFWHDGIMFLGITLLFPLLIMGADYGAHALGDSRREASEFLLTRPRSRSHFAWTGWLAGLSQVGAAAMAAGLAGVLILRLPSGSVRFQAVAGLAAFLLLVPALLHGVAYLTAVASGNPRQGYSAAVAVAIAYWVYVIAGEVLFDMSDAPALLSVLSWGVGRAAFPLLLFQVALLLLVLLPWVSSKALQRREI